VSTYVVGDIQGCYQELVALLDAVNFDASEDHLWVAGDMINRGPDNLATIELLRQIPNIQIILGNHDLHFLAVALTDRKPSRSDTIIDLLSSEQLNEITEWLRLQKLAFYSEAFDLLVVHAGIPHTWTIKQALGYASEVEAVIKSNQHLMFFEQMYGNEPTQLALELTGMDRWRVITNYFTRLRFCAADGSMELITKTDIAPPGYAPWFEFPRQEASRILFGHWAAIEGKTSSKQFVALDTGCVWGRELSALRLEDNKLFSVPARSGQ
jgi:bis(5'-nucleosyl)-tetraphosphatase (symmetrical)